MSAGLPEPLVSVILPTYNSAGGLSKSVSSILRQTYADLELLIVDDGSTDATRDVLAGFTDPRITVIRHPENYGVARAYNTGVDAARGSFIGFIGSSDEWLPEKLAEEISRFSGLSPEYGVVYSDLWEITRSGERKYWQNPAIAGPELINSAGTDYQVNYLGNGAVLVRREYLDRAGAFDEQFRCFSDTDMIIRLQRLCRFHHIRKPLYVYYSNRGLSSNPVEVSIARLLLLKKYPEGMQNLTFLMHQHDMIRTSLRSAGVDNRMSGSGYEKDQSGSIAENLSRILDDRVIRHICPAGSRRNRLYARGLAAVRRHLNPLLRSRRT
jgi:glycosyltransferase involved in cell wall biosynthesis